MPVTSTVAKNTAEAKAIRKTPTINLECRLMTTSRDLGVQPLDTLLSQLAVTNADLVKHSTEQLTHKMVSRGRKGRLLTYHVQTKICNALNHYQSEKQYQVKDIFNYEGSRGSRRKK